MFSYRNICSLMYVIRNITANPKPYFFHALFASTANECTELTVRCADEFFFTPPCPGNRYIALAHSRNYGLPALPRAFFCLWIVGR